MDECQLISTAIIDRPIHFILFIAIVCVQTSRSYCFHKNKIQRIALTEIMEQNSSQGLLPNMIELMTDYSVCRCLNRKVVSSVVFNRLRELSNIANAGQLCAAVKNKAKGCENIMHREMFSQFSTAILQEM